MDQRKNTILGLITIGLCCMAFAWIVEMLFIANMQVDSAGTDGQSVLESIQRMRSFTSISYGLGVLFILAGAFRLSKLQVAVLDTGE